jgi:hypothetical protein
MPVARVELALPHDSMRVGQKLQLTVALRAADDAVLEGSVTYASSDTLVAMIDETGLITARGVGTAHVTAAGGGESMTAPLAVTAVPVAALTLAPIRGVLLTGDSMQLDALAVDSAGEFTAGNRIHWSVDDSTVAQVNARGRIIAANAGQVRVVAAVGERADTAVVTVHLGAGPRAPEFAAVDSAVAALVEQHGIRSATVVIVRRGKLAFLRSYASTGARVEPESSRPPVTPQTLRESIAKTMKDGGLVKLLCVKHDACSPTGEGHLIFQGRPVLEYLAPLTAPGGGAPEPAVAFLNDGGASVMLLTTGVAGNRHDIFGPIQTAIRKALPGAATWPTRDLFAGF